MCIYSADTDKIIAVVLNNIDIKLKLIYEVFFTIAVQKTCILYFCNACTYCNVRQFLRKKKKLSQFQQEYIKQHSNFQTLIDSEKGFLSSTSTY